MMQLSSCYCVLLWTGVTQEQIDETRLLTETTMLSDMQNILNDGGSFEYRGQSGETPVLHLLQCTC